MVADGPLRTGSIIVAGQVTNSADADARGLRFKAPAVVDRRTIGVSQAPVHPDCSRDTKTRVGAVEARCACAALTNADRAVHRSLACLAAAAGRVQFIADAVASIYIRVVGGVAEADAVVAAVGVVEVREAVGI